MIKIEINGLKEVQQTLKDLSERRIKAAAATALTRTAVIVRDEVKKRMLSDLNNPTPYTQRQLLYTAAKADNLVAAVGFNIAPIQDARGNTIRYQELVADKRPAAKYLQYQIDGGSRSSKGLENALRRVGVLPQGWFAVPGAKAKMDAYGNQSVGQIVQIISWFDAFERVAGARQNMRDAGRQRRMKGTKKTAGWEFFAVQPGAVRTWTRSNGKIGTHKMQPGIYRRTAGLKNIEPIMIFVKKASYGRRFNFNDIAQSVGNANLRREFDRAIDEHMAKLKGGR